MRYTIKVKNHFTTNEGDVKRTDKVMQGGKECLHVSVAAQQNDRLELYFTKEELMKIVLDTEMKDLMDTLKKCKLYMHDLEVDNIEDRTAGIFRDPHLTAAYNSLVRLLEHFKWVKDESKLP